MGVFAKLFSFIKPKAKPPTQGLQWARAHAKAVAEKREQILNPPIRSSPPQDRRKFDERSERLFRKMERAAERDEARLKEILEGPLPPLWAGDWIDTPGSTYMTRFRYDAAKQELFVMHHDGSHYGYAQVTEHMAASLERAGSKGTWMWDNIRIRGTVYGHRVPYWIIGGIELRQWAKSIKTGMERDVAIEQLGGFHQVKRIEGGQTFSTLMSKFARKTPVENKGRRIKVGPQNQ